MREVLHFKSTKERLQYLNHELEEIVPEEAVEKEPEVAEEPKAEEEKPKKKATPKKGKKKDEVQAK